MKYKIKYELNFLGKNKKDFKYRKTKVKKCVALLIKTC